MKPQKSEIAFIDSRGFIKSSLLFARTLLSQSGVVGYGYFMWLDQPSAGIRQSFPEDCNYGLVREDGSVYEGLTQMFRRVHYQASQIRLDGTPVERRLADEAVLTEAERFADQNRTARGDVSFSQTGGVWRVDNGGGLVLSGRVNGKRMIEDIRIGVCSIGAYGGMLKIVRGGSPFWIDGGKTVDVRFQPATGQSPAAVLCTSEGAGWGVRFRLVHKFLISPQTTDFVAQVVSVENLSAEDLEIDSFFSRAFANSEDAIPEASAPNLWKAEPKAVWAYPDGRRLFMRSCDPSVRSVRFWREKNGTQHPDAEFATPSFGPLPKGLVVTPAQAMSVRIGGGCIGHDFR